GGHDAEHADGPGEGGGHGPDLVGAGGDPVAAGCGQGAHGDDHRHHLAGLGDFVADHLGGKGAAAGAVEPEHQGLELLVLAGGLEQGGEGVAADGALRLVAIEDGAGGDDHADGIPVAGAIETGQAQVGQVGLVVDVEIAVLVLSHQLGEAAAAGGARGEVVYEACVESEPAAIAAELADPGAAAVVATVDATGGPSP